MTTEIETDTINRIDELIANLNRARDDYKSWANEQPVDGEFLDRERQEWARAKPWDYAYSPDKANAWDLIEPGLNSLSPVKAVKIKIANFRKELASAESDLQALVQKGAPFTSYLNAVAAVEVAITSLVQRVLKERLESVLERQYGTTNFPRLPRDVVRSAKLHRDVVMLDIFKFHGRLGVMREADVSIRDVDDAFERVTAALEEVKELIAGEDKKTLAPIT